MNRSTVTIRMDPDLKRQLADLCKQTCRTQSDLIRDAIKRQIAIIRFRQIRHKVVPLAEAKGYISDEDVFRDIS
jgi:predicted transcriptional regulator